MILGNLPDFGYLDSMIHGFKRPLCVCQKDQREDYVPMLMVYSWQRNDLEIIEATYERK